MNALSDQLMKVIRLGQKKEGDVEHRPLKVVCNNSDIIKKAIRVKKKLVSTAYKIAFDSTKMQQAAYKAARGVGVVDENTPIFISEDISKDTYTLFKKAKELKNMDYKHVWHRDGKILPRKNDNDKPVHIINEAMLDELLG
ncbi:unnamed protein product [Ceutorhynchus assimilis]|uniref:FP protein C-terminal domain-containing protein n=1 Tax=Ceutorhynchus assimilis TaxID=467358 RepID=A0A9N9MPA9_9CUCU|nr:unnamed protein product [Ceutorhynchus assimilis]